MIFFPFDFIIQGNDQSETGRAFPYKLHYPSQHNYREENNYNEEKKSVVSQNGYDISEYNYKSPHRRKWRRVGQNIDRTFDVIGATVASAFGEVVTSAQLQVSQKI